MKTPKQWRQQSEQQTEADRRSEHNADVFAACILVFLILCIIFG